MAEHMPRNKIENGITGMLQISIYKKKNKDMNWDPEQLQEGFLNPGDRGEKYSRHNSSTSLFFSSNESLFANFFLLMEDDFFESRGLIHIIGMKIMITDVTSMLV